MHTHDAGWIRRRLLHGKLGVQAFRKQALTLSDRQRIDKQVQLVDEIVRKQRVHELAASIGDDVLARLCLEGANRVDDVVANDPIR